VLVNLERAHRKGMDGTGNMNNGMSWSIYDMNGREVICIQEKEMVFMILIALSRRFYFDNEQDYVHLGPTI